MKLTEARAKFYLLRTDKNRILVGFHVRNAHPERNFTVKEVQDLISTGQGRLDDNNKMPSSQPGSFMFNCLDEDERCCEIGIRFEEIGPDEYILVIHAFRRMKQ